MRSDSAFSRTLFMLALVVSGEAIFGLPFHITRFFRPTLLRVLEIDQTELGTAMSAYGVVAMVSYFAGGPLADRFSARRLMTASLISTAAGGLVLASRPSMTTLMVLYGFFGLTTILLFWGALIRATREWGGENETGRAFGLLDSGRGLLAAVVAWIGVRVLGGLMPEDVAGATDAERSGALSTVVYVYAVVTLAAAALVWFGVPDRDSAARSDGATRRGLFEGIRAVSRMPRIWLQAGIVVCAYVAFKGIDFYSSYAVDAYGMDEVRAAEVSTISAWVRPPAALIAGVLADRVRGSHIVIACFAVLAAAYGSLALYTPRPDALTILYLSVIVTAAMAFALRGVYFALLREAAVPFAVTGTAVGIISFIGFTPDVFFAPFAGILLDGAPGITGYQHLFWVLTGAAVVGLTCAMAFRDLGGRTSPEE